MIFAGILRKKFSRLLLTTASASRLTVSTSIFGLGKYMSDSTRDQKPHNRPVTDEAIFKVTKEIVVKFIEVGRLTPANFSETFTQVYATVKDTVRPE
jgi:hypothetical protein